MNCHLRPNIKAVNLMTAKTMLMAFEQALLVAMH